MSFGAFFAILVLMLVCAPQQFAALGHNMIVGVTPIAKEGLTLAIIIAALVAIVKSKF